MDEIRAARESNLGLKLVVGHGSGSFGHIPAKRYGTRLGVRSAESWAGFAEVWREARALNAIVTEAFCQAQLPVIVFPPSAAVVTENGRVASWDIYPLQAALDSGLIPLVYGDVVFDRTIGGTILSTEDLFGHLVDRLNPERILLAGIEDGVWADYPERHHLLPVISPSNLPAVRSALQGSAATDVTGGMLQKVESMLGLVQQIPKLEVLIFSGTQPGSLKDALLGASPGTIIRADGTD